MPLDIRERYKDWKMNTEDMPGLTLKDVSLHVKGHKLLGPLSLSVEEGHVATLMGPSGAGKSSLLAFVSGTLSPDIIASGSVHLDGRRIDGLNPEERRVGLLFQDDLLFPHLSILENVAFGIPRTVRGRRARAELALSALGEAGLEGFRDKMPMTLSGGQRARISLLRVLLSEPRALLLDEPFSAFDTTLRHQMHEFVFAHVKASRLPTLLVTHDKSDADAAGGPVIEIS